MTQNNITEGSKLIAEFLGWKYVPNNDLGNFPKAGWYCESPKGLPILSPKQGYPHKLDNRFYKYICRSHNDLRFYNSFDALIPSIEKLEKEFENIHFELLFGGCTLMCKNTDELFIDSFHKELTWIQNTFTVVVETIKNIQK